MSCTSPTDCVAVGGGLGLRQKTVVQSFDGTTWSITPSPNPGKGDNSLNAVSCTSATACMAVGGFVAGGRSSKTLVLLGATPAPMIKKVRPSSAKVGAEVTITGVHLSRATAVTFNGTAAVITTDTATKIITAVPAGATTGTVEVTTPGGTATSVGVFTVT